MQFVENGSFREKEYGRSFGYSDTPPNEWAAERGATHNVHVADPNCPDRPARVLKTVAYIGVDENADGNIVWEKWHIDCHYRYTAN